MRLTPVRSRRACWALRPWALVALAIAAITACAGSPADSGTEPTSPAPSQSRPAGTTVDHLIDLSAFPPIRLTAPETWAAIDNWGVVRDEATVSAAAVTFWRVTHIFGEPCRWNGTLVDPGPSVDDLANALTTVPTRNATPPEATSVGGVDGLSLEWSVPQDEDLEWSEWNTFTACDEGFFESWRSDQGGTDRYQQMPGQVDRLWILDLDGERLVIDAFYLPDTPAATRDEIDDIIGSIRFG